MSTVTENTDSRSPMSCALTADEMISANVRREMVSRGTPDYILAHALNVSLARVADLLEGKSSWYIAELVHAALLFRLPTCTDLLREI